MPSHQKAIKSSQDLCDLLQDELRKTIPDLSVAASNNTCGLYRPRYNRFAYVYHRSDTALIRVYFRGDPIVQPSDPSHRLTVHVRPVIKEGWDKEFPFFLIIADCNDIPVAAKILLEFACPLSARKTRKMVASQIDEKDLTTPEQIPDGVELPEGAMKQIRVNVYERNPTARILCIKHYGAKCSICEFNFQKAYGERGIGFIHVHHIRGLAEIKASYSVNPVEDLRPVCPNCHAMIHRTNPPAACEEIKALLRKRAQQAATCNRSTCGK